MLPLTFVLTRIPAMAMHSRQCLFVLLLAITLHQSLLLPPADAGIEGDDDDDVLLATFDDGSVETLDLDVVGAGRDDDEEEEVFVLDEGDIRSEEDVDGEVDLRRSNGDGGIDDGLRTEQEDEEDFSGGCGTTWLPFSPALSVYSPVRGVMACDAYADECAVLPISRDGLEKNWVEMNR